ncbi:MAG: glycerol-3-phosphate dehydrogenase/oxidase [Chloroflexi bacterium]|nr:glycerol-3-phosphate dehydrogenase/oxidase [Chloroflexota bacterium]
MNRNEALSSLKTNPEISALIVGAGINGIGTFRDLTLNGVDALLIDRGDFCSGASAASSHMAHGGIRYLENGEFRLVREAVRERNRMIQNAPHIVSPLPTTIPMFKYFSGLFNAPLKFLGLLDKPSERGAVIIKLGLMMYDAYTGKTRIVPRHQFMLRKESLKRWPLLNPNIVTTAVYYDGLISNPERLALEIVLDAEAENPNARALNYVSLMGADKDSVFLKDELTGETYVVRPKLLINAAGPWIDAANRKMGLSTRYIAGTKGSHVVVEHPELRAAIGNNEFFFENKDGRIVLLFPLYDRVLIGTSDIKIEDPDDVHCTEEEIEYFLELVTRVFPSIKVGREHIVFQFTGVRPLGSSGEAKTTAQYSRDHHIEILDSANTNLSFPVYSLVGGKWTSFRAFSEQVADKALAFFGKPRQKSTANLPIGGGRGYSADPAEQKRQIEGLAAWTGLDRERLSVLYARYGSRIETISRFMNLEKDEPLKSIPDYTRREILFLIQHEKCARLEDLLLRRTMLAMLGRLNAEAARELGDLFGDCMGWDAARKNAELEHTLDLLRNRHGMKL